MTYFDFICAHPFIGAAWTLIVYSMLLTLTILLPGSWAKK